MSSSTARMVKKEDIKIEASEGATEGESESEECKADLSSADLTIAFFSNEAEDEVAAAGPVYRANEDKVVAYDPVQVGSSREDKVVEVKKRKVNYDTLQYLVTMAYR